MMAETMQLSASLEDYLEAIHHIVAEKQAARAKDIVMRLGVHNSSVTQALRALSEKGLVNYAPYDLITLTDAGEQLADDVVKRHETLKTFLIKVLAIEARDAEQNACRMEHAISPVVRDRLVEFVEYFESCPVNRVQWREDSGFYCDWVEQDGPRECSRDDCPIRPDGS